MRFDLHATGLTSLQTPLLAVPAYADDAGRGPWFEAADALSGGRLTAIADEEGFDGKAGKTLLVHTPDSTARRVLLVGAGKASDASVQDARSLAAAAVQAANARKLGSVAIAIATGDDGAAAVHFGAVGAALGGYRYDTYLTQDVEPLTCDGVTLATNEPVEGGREALRIASATAEGIILARELVNGPPAEVTPTRLAEVAAELATDLGYEIEVLDKQAILDAGMNLLMAVGVGSDEEPRLIRVTYRPSGATADTPQVALVGKGITFDAGGYNLKPTGAIEDMKIDMAGAAAVLGAMRAVAAIAPKYVVHGIVPAAENLISGAAYKDGDIIRSLNGKTVEIMNTDAEGRLVLADALCWAERMGVTRIVDLATLTGACMVALGPHTAALFSNDDDFAGRLRSASESAGESLWRMPLDKKLRPMLKSATADMKNVGERWGGAITAALFLQEFVGDVTWAHLDIAGPASADKPDGHIAKGGTGFGVATLLELLKGDI